MSDNDTGWGQTGPSFNPYDAAATGSARTALIKPTSVTVFGILNLVFALMGICGIGFSVVVMAMQGAMKESMEAGGETNPVFEIMQDNPAFMVYQIATVVVGLFTTLMLFFAGIGLLQGKPWGRSLSVWYSMLTILFTLVSIIANYFLLIRPLLDKAAEMPEGAEKFSVLLSAFSQGAGCVGLVYPIVLLIFMKRQSVVSYFKAVAAQS